VASAGEPSLASEHTPQASPICILGMHRSGTSLVTRILNLMGAYLGPDQSLISPKPDNPRGFWEQKSIMDLNNDLLKELGGSWDKPPAFNDGWESSPELEGLQSRAREIIERDFSSSSNWAWKDPRSCLTLPFWQRLLPRMRYVFCLRNPVDVALSLQNRDGIAINHGAQLWLTYVRSSLANTAGLPRLFVFYEDLMTDWQQEAARLSRFLQLPDPIKSPNTAREVSDFIEAGLQHHRSSVGEALIASEVSLPAKALYLALRLWNTLEEPGNDPVQAATSEALDQFAEQCFTSEKEAEDLARSAEAQILALSNDIEEQKRLLHELRTEVATLRAQSDEKQAVLETKEAELEKIKSTLGWRILAYYGRIKHGFLLPIYRRFRPDSRR